MNSGIHILLVDDSEADNFLHTRVIKRAGVANQISTAGNGAEALALLDAIVAGDNASPFPNAIFVDINMPIMDGWEFVDAYRDRFAGRTEAVVIAMVTTSVMDRDVERAVAHEVVDRHIEKPLTEEYLRELLETHFRGDV